MTNSSKPENDGYGLAITVSTITHILVLVLALYLTENQNQPIYTPLAVMDFAHYDPEGGQPLGSETPEAPLEPLAPEPPPEPEAEPEPLPQVVESQSQEAAIIPPPPPPDKKPVVKKTRPKPAPALVGLPNPNPNVVGSGGVGGGTGRGNPDLLSAYKSQISRRLNQYKKYPTAAMSRGLKGVVKVSFRVNANGRVSIARMVASSGFAVLDDEALALLKRCSPFPPIPKDLGLNDLDLSVPISFTARN
ncbi:MAG: energy transducer TonB [Deltaproteobacteria bacterium]|jgi:protein TonB|nr:energy transducer TonB [Deltaproteobacteria bacterium]